MKIAKYTIEEMAEGMSSSLTKTIIPKDVDLFAAISGDRSPLHMSDAFAISQGFPRRVVHGALLTSYISQMLGVQFPGENCLLQSLNIKFHAPCLIGDTVEIKAQVIQVSIAVNAVVLEILVENVHTHVHLVKAKAQVGFLKNQQQMVQQ